MKTKRNYTVACFWAQGTSKKGKIDSHSNLSYQEAKNLQREWANEELDLFIETNFRTKTAEMGDCSISVIKTDLFEKYKEGQIEYYEMFNQ